MTTRRKRTSELTATHAHPNGTTAKTRYHGRHGALRERIAAQRQALVSHAGPLESALGGVDKALAGVDWLKAHPAPERREQR